MNIRRIALGFLLLGVFSISACVDKGTHLTPANVKKLWQSENPKTETTQIVIERWTREDKLYSEFETILIVSALYKSWAVRQTYLEQEAAINNMSPEKKLAKLREERDLYDNENSFIVSAYLGDKSWNDFSEPSTVWKIYMVTKEGIKIYPEKIEKIEDIKSDSLLKYCYFITPWKTTYRVTFPKMISQRAHPVIQESEGFKLELVSHLGTAALKWE